MNYFLFNSNIELAKVSDEFSEIDTFFIDLEIIGKEKRQKDRNTLISYHQLNDIDNVRKYLRKTLLGVRTNPIHDKIQTEVNSCISRGADVLMLPMFKKIDEIKYYLDLVNGRCAIDLLLETPESLNLINQIPFEDIRYIHFGINDLSIALNYKLMFQMYLDKNLNLATDYLRMANQIFGIGGIGALGSLPISPELIFVGSIKHGAKRLILSRSFISKIDFNNIYFSLKNNLNSLSSLYQDLKTLPDKEIKKKFLNFSNTIEQLIK